MPAQGPGTAPGPLVALSQLLKRAGPPNLSHLLALFGQAEEYGEFARLVRELLPDREAEILGQGILEGVQAFVQAFQERYFPLDFWEDDQAESLRDLTRFIPVYPQGLGDDDYHDLPNLRPGAVLASLLVGFEEEIGLEGEGIRITLLEEAARRVPKGLLGRIPEGGYPRGFLEQTLAGTPYQGLIAHARYLCHDTGSFFLDVTHEGIWDNPPDWDRATVEALTEEWQHAQAIQEEGDTFFDWLEEEPEAHLAEVLDFLGRRWRGKHRKRG